MAKNTLNEKNILNKMKKQITLVRINSRVTPEQLKFIKDQAKKLKISEGHVLRNILNNLIK